MLKDAIWPLVSGKPYGVTVMQTDGLNIYDTDPNQIEKNLFTDPMYADAPSLLELGRHIAAEPSGSGTYSFEPNAPTTQQTFCYWNTVYAYGQQWRVTIQH